MNSVFVYGTLKAGQSNYALLQSSEFVGRGTTLKPYWMLSTGGFPVVFDDHQHHNVAGELYNVTDEILKRLDRLEGHPDWFCRKEIIVDIADTGIQHTAWMYFGVPEAWPSRPQLRVVQPDATGAYVWSRQ